MATPKISVLMPAYNTNPEFLRAALDSILDQSFSDFEFLILDDASSDPGVEEQIKARPDPRIVFERNERNLGISPTRNRLMDMAKGEYLAVMDHDDISLPERLARQAAFLDANPEVGVLSCAFLRVPRNVLVRYPLDHEEIERKLMFGTALSHSSAMLRKSAIQAAGARYEEKYSPAEDYALWCRLIGKTRFANLDEALFHYRSYSSNTTKRRADKMKAADAAIKDFARRDNPELWAQAQAFAKEITRHKLFGALPIWTTKRSPEKTEHLLFDKLPLLTSRTKTVI